MQIKLTLRNALRDYRRDAGLSQEEAARRAGISLTYVRKIEQPGGRTEVPARTILAVALAVGASSPSC